MSEVATTTPTLKPGPQRRFDATDRPARRLDGVVENLAAGLGDPAFDKSRHTRPAPLTRLSLKEKEALYEASWACRRICDALGQEGTRAWTQLKLGGDANPEQLDNFTQYEQRLNVRQAWRRSSSWSRTYGGAAIVVYVNDGQPSDSPIDYNNIQSVDGLDVMDRYEIYPETTISHDPLLPDFYRVLDGTRMRDGEKVDLAKATATIHPDRVIRMDGFEMPRRVMMRNSNWGGSVLDNIWTAFSRYESVNASIEAMIHDFDLFVYMMQGLGDLMASTNDKDLAKLNKRLRSMQFSKSNLKGLVLDADSEKAEFASRNLSGLAELVDVFKNELIGASGLPHNVIFGDAAGGLGSTGDAEDGLWVKIAEQYQEEQFRPSLDRLYRLIWLAKDGPTGGKLPKDWSFSFKPLYRRSLSSEIELQGSQASNDESYLQMGALTVDEIRASRFGGSEFRFETVLDEAAWKKKKEEEAFDPSQYDFSSGEQEQAPIEDNPVDENGQPITAPE